MIDKGKISVVMSVYNENKEILIEAINSILNQTYKNIEFIIVLDNPENKDLKRILIEYETIDNRIIFIENDKNLGLVNSLNKALSFCTGEFIARMDADDISHLDRLAIQVSSLEKYNCDFVTSRANVINENGEFLYKVKNYTLDYKVSNKLLTIKCIHFHPTWLFKRSVLDKVKEYHNRNFVEDYDFLCRVAINGFKIVTLDKYLLDVRVRERGITKSNIYEQYINSKLIKNALNKSLINNNINLYETILNNNIEISKSEKDKYINQFNNYKNNSTNLKKVKSVYNLFKVSSDIVLKKYAREEFLNNIYIKLILRKNKEYGKVNIWN